MGNHKTGEVPGFLDKTAVHCQATAENQGSGDPTFFRKTIGSVRDVNGLYYFEGDIVMSAQAQATSSEISFVLKMK
ncbi:hypothetical protein CK203_103941 [Vitis vinifera]|uniref:Uncharacterized protein n=1 Tax=Vitis vinifera TaxID=29760 RepID=A0A438CUI6_VITVI|nr:hypothetical protein CK203_103941 [Vitis vinifera]